jgi:hypothetical protein
VFLQQSPAVRQLKHKIIRGALNTAAVWAAQQIVVSRPSSNAWTTSGDWVGFVIPTLNTFRRLVHGQERVSN